MLLPLVMWTLLMIVRSELDDYSFYEPGAPLRRQFELLEQKPHMMITCTSTTVIGELKYRLTPPAPEPDSAPPWVVYRLSEPPESGDRSADPYPTLQRCLGHRACAFRFSNEFCGRDPAPGRRKRILLMVSCFEDINHSNAAVVHLQYRSLLEAGVRNYPAVTVEERLQPADLVFGLRCPRDRQAAAAAGYHGVCSGQVDDPDQLRQRAAFILATTHSAQCRKQLSQVLCSLAFSRSAECLPPFMWSEERPSELVAPRFGDGSDGMTGSVPAAS
ncbi:uncharacterized protein LOC122370886, partial [Amphibalanus amphitrite]|uniref:uncharacterized protein LOC122370886 n=1 Tax=Amphibalanus amphitrite TaxID=1232801 RepID=UPI001C90B4D9